MKKQISLLIILAFVCSSFILPIDAEQSMPFVSETSKREPAIIGELEPSVYDFDTLEYPSGEFFGHRPSVYRPDWLNEEQEPENIRRQSSLPASYDLRQQGRLSPIRDQGQNLDCWSFATMGALESSLMPQPYDFSEKHLVDHSGFFEVKKRGGTMHMALAYLARQQGPVSEDSDPYDKLEPVSGLEPIVHLRSAYRIPASQIKQMILRYGGVQTAIYSTPNHPKYFNKNTSSQFVDQSRNENHEVVIVGWDDDYPKEKFRIPPQKNGAWIAKNSWGEDWGEQGYYYISYEDRTIGRDNIVYAEIANSKWYDQIYQYDEYGRRSTYGYRSPHLKDNWFANVFKTKNSKERLVSVAFHTNEPQIPYEIWIDTDFTDRFDTLRKVHAGMMEHAGYHTVDLPQEEPILGERFAVAIKIGYHKELPICIEKNKKNYLYNATSHPKESFVSRDGKHWEDAKFATYKQNGQEFVLDANVCLKAFTVGGEPSNEPAQEPDELQQASWYRPEEERMTSDPNKVWRVRFNQTLEELSIFGQVKVFDAVSYQEIPVTAQMTEDNQSISVRPHEAYRQRRDYILYVGTLRSASGKELRPIKAKFQVQ